MIYGYIRVSTDKQTMENQKYEILKFAKKNKIKINKWIEETTSSTTNMKKRKLGGLLNKIKKNDILISSELSRLGRNLLQVMGILHHCLSKECQVWTIKDNYRLGTDIQSKVLAFAFGLSAEIERNLISQRTQEALNRLKSEGIKLGRKEGTLNRKHLLDYQEQEIKRLLDEGVHLAKIARSMQVSRGTLYRLKSRVL